MGDWLRAAAQMLAATGITAALACLGWTVVMRQKGGLCGVVEECISAAHPEAPGAKTVDTDRVSTAGSSAANRGPTVVNGGSIARNSEGLRVGDGGSALSVSSCDDSAGAARGVSNGH